MWGSLFYRTRYFSARFFGGLKIPIPSDPWVPVHESVAVWIDQTEPTDRWIPAVEPVAGWVAE